MPKPDHVRDFRPPTRVLLIEPDPDLLGAGSRQLRRAGFVVEEFVTTIDALERLASDNTIVDVIGTSLDVADVSAFDGVEALRYASDAPLIAWTEEPSVDLTAGLTKRGVGEVLLRDLLADDLLPAVQRLAGPEPLPERRNLREGAKSVVGTDDLSLLVRSTIESLAAIVPMDTWAFTRVVQNDWQVLDAIGSEYGVVAGDRLRWSDSFCARMVNGEGPMVSGQAGDVLAFASAPIAKSLDIGSYIGLPITIDADSLFGTICAIDPRRRPAGELEALGPMLAIVARTLSSALAIDRRRAAAERRADIAIAAARSDALTGLGNRRAWDLLLQAEEERCNRYGVEAAVLILDLDGLKVVNDHRGHASGDRMIRTAGQVLAREVRGSDAAFRIGGDEFGVLAIECGESCADHLRDRLSASFEESGIEVSIGVGVRTFVETLGEAVLRADMDMYRRKR